MVLQAEINQNQIPNEPELADLLAMFKKQLLLGFNCHHIATIQSFNALTQTAKATINYKKTYFQPDLLGVLQPVLKSYPIIVDAPVVSLGGGGYSLTFPISSGDECIVMFNDRDFDVWFAGSSNAAVATPRLHAFTDAMLLVGVRSLKNVILNYSEDGIELRNLTGLTKVSVTDDAISVVVGPTSIEVDLDGKVKITNASGEFIASLLQLLQTATTVTMLGSQPLVFDPATLLIVESFKAT